MKWLIFSFLCYSAATGFLLEFQLQQNKTFYTGEILVSGELLNTGNTKPMRRLEFITCQFSNKETMICNITYEVIYVKILYSKKAVSVLIDEKCTDLNDRASWILAKDNEINVDIFMVNQTDSEIRLTSDMFKEYPSEREQSSPNMCWKLCNKKNDVICASIKDASGGYSNLIVSIIVFVILLSVVLVLGSLRFLLLKYM